MANLKVNCSMCLEILRRFPRQAISVPGTFQMQCHNINAVSAYHNVLSHVMGNEDSPVLPTLLSVLFFWLAMVLFLQSLHNSSEGTWCTL